jgi:hypothetical protein
MLLFICCSAEMLEMYKGFVENYGVITIEDPYEQDDWDNWKAITADVSCQIVGDDQLVTNPTRIKKAIEQKASNALLLKVRRSAACTVICAAVLSRPCRWCSGGDAVDVVCLPAVSCDASSAEPLLRHLPGQHCSIPNPPVPCLACVTFHAHTP